MSADVTTQSTGPLPATEPTAAQSAEPRRLSRAERNRRNARFSTGPRTREGKNISRMNACDHGGTAQTVILPADDMAAYLKFSADQIAALKPEGADETAFTQTIVDTRWQLARTQTFENNLIYLLPSPPNDLNLGGESPERRAQLKAAESAARTFFENLHKFDLMSRYSARLSRLVIQNHDKLTKMQTARLEAEREAEREDQWNAMRRQPSSFEFDIAHLPENIQRRMRQLHEEQQREAAEAATQHVNLRPADPSNCQANQQPATNSGFVSQRPQSSPHATTGERKTIREIAQENLKNRAA